MTTPAEVVAGVRAILVEMMAEVDRFRAQIPVGTFLEANLARDCFKKERYGQAADHARSVIAALRRIPAGAVQLETADLALIRMMADALASSNSELIDEGAEGSAALSAGLGRLVALLNSAKAVYVVTNEETVQ